MIANRLTEDDNVNVLLIEAGGDTPVDSVVSLKYTNNYIIAEVHNVLVKEKCWSSC